MIELWRGGVACGEVAALLGGPEAFIPGAVVCLALAQFGFDPIALAGKLERELLR